MPRPSPYPIMFNFTLYVYAQNFHMMNINMPADIGTPPLSTQHLDKWLPTVICWELSFWPMDYSGTYSCLTSWVCYVRLNISQKCELPSKWHSAILLQMQSARWGCVSTVASLPGLPRCFLPFAFTIIHGSGRPMKNGEDPKAFITWVDGCEVDVVGEGLVFKYVRSKLESEFLTGQDK